MASTAVQVHKDHREGLGFCNLCTKEYADNEALNEVGSSLAGLNDAVKYCPFCLGSNKTYYYCQIHQDDIHAPQDCVKSND